LNFVLLSTDQPYLTDRGLIYINFSRVGVKSQEKVNLVRDKNMTLAVAPKRGEFRVLDFGTKTTAVASSDRWLLKVGVKI
jgi:hypothetical protein